nr:conserved hypothetical protein [Albugo laibachii Nc14]|eukprot:CCA19792.1 conserved hypothetical protein [Albugo laibachii Nc14]
MYLPSTINNMINLHQVKQQEQEIYCILLSATRNELNYILNNVRLALLFYKVKDHSTKLRSDQHRTVILDLLCVKRVTELTITSRAILLDALMVMRLSAHPLSEKWVRNIILKTSGDDLSLLKTYTDAKGDFHSLHKLVFNDIRDVKIRHDILQHIHREASIQTAHMRLGTRKAMVRKLQAWRKVLSDVDDTLYSSGGRYPAGIDVRYPRHVVYPGVLSFYRELDIGTTGPDEWDENRVGNLVFLSARPHVYKDMSEKKSYAKFAALYARKKMHTLPTMLAGSLQSGRAYMVRGNLEPMALKKYENFCEFYQLYPEFKHVFIGDNGQGDVRAAQLIAERFGSGILEAGYFHLVQPLEKTYGIRTKEDLEKCRRMNIVFFNTYVGATVEAYKLQQIRLSGLQRIAQEAAMSFKSITNWSSANTRETQRIHMNQDIERANAILRRHKLIPIDFIAKPQVYAQNALVHTPFGRAVVRKYRPIDGIYKVELLDWKTQKRLGYFVEDSLATYTTGIFTNLEKGSCSYVRFRRPSVTVLAPGTSVKTRFGNGRILKFRLEDEVYKVHLYSSTGKMLAAAYLTSSCIKVASKESDSNSPTMFSGVRSRLGYFTRALTNFVPGSGIKSLFANNAAVESPFGRASVVQFRSVDRVYVIALTEGSLHGVHAFVHEDKLREACVSPSRNFFSLLWAGSDKSARRRAVAFPTCTKVTTPYGIGLVQSYRKDDSIYKIVLVDLSTLKHQVLGYLHEAYVRELPKRQHDSLTTTIAESNPVDKGTSTSMQAAPSSGNGRGLFQLFRYSISYSNSKCKSISNPYANQGASRRIHTPLGFAKTDMGKSYRGVYKAFLEKKHCSLAAYYVQEYEMVDVSETAPRRNTLELIGSYLWHSSRRNRNTDFTAESVLAADTPQSMDRAYYQSQFALGAFVRSMFGHGILLHFRPRDNIYVVRIGSTVAYLQVDRIEVPNKAGVGCRVMTTFGTGFLLSVREDNIHTVSIRHSIPPSSDIYAYLQPSCIAGQISAVRGDVVATPYGPGVVLGYRPRDRFYIVALHWITSKNAKSDVLFRAVAQSHVTAYVREDQIFLNLKEHKRSQCKVM